MEAVPSGRSGDLDPNPPIWDVCTLTDGLCGNKRYESALASHDTHVLREKLNEGPGLFMHQHPLRGDLERRRDGKIPWFPGHCPRLPFTIQDSAHTKVMSQA